jgi:hypothetical protein
VCVCFSSCEIIHKKLLAKICFTAALPSSGCFASSHHRGYKLQRLHFPPATTPAQPREPPREVLHHGARQTSPRLRLGLIAIITAGSFGRRLHSAADDVHAPRDAPAAPAAAAAPAAPLCLCSVAPGPRCSGASCI